MKKKTKANKKAHRLIASQDQSLGDRMGGK